MSKELLLQKAIAACTDLTNTVRGLHDSIQSKVTQAQTEYTQLKQSLTNDNNAMKNDLASVIPIGPNLIHDTSSYSRMCEGKLNTSYDLFKPTEASKFTQNETAGVHGIAGYDTTRSSLTAELVNIFDPAANKKYPGLLPKANDAIYSKLVTNNTINDGNNPLLNRALVFKLKLYLKSTYKDNQQNAVDIIIRNPSACTKRVGYTLNNSFNPNIYVSQLFNLLDFKDPPIGHSFYIESPANHVQLYPIQKFVDRNNGKTILRKENDGAGWDSNTSIEYDPSQHLGKWRHLIAKHPTHYGCSDLLNISLYTNHAYGTTGNDVPNTHYVDEPFEMTFAIFLTYAGYGDFGTRLVWMPESHPLDFNRVLMDVDYRFTDSAHHIRYNKYN